MKKDTQERNLKFLFFYSLPCNAGFFIGQRRINSANMRAD